MAMEGMVLVSVRACGSWDELWSIFQLIAVLDYLRINTSCMEWVCMYVCICTFVYMYVYICIFIYVYIYIIIC